MKKISNLKRDTILKVFLLIIIVILFGLLMFQPERFGYEYSLKSIHAKRQTFESLNSEVLQEQQILNGKQIDFDNFSKELNIKQQDSLEIEKKLNISDLNLHIPSLLLVLEEQAVKNNLTIHIRYDEKQTINSSGSIPEANNNTEGETLVLDPNIEPNLDNSNVGSDVSNINEEQKTDENSSTNNSSGSISLDYMSEKNSLTQESLSDIKNIPPIEGLTILALPVDIEGSYESLRNFIKFLDTMDFLIPYSVNVETQGDYVIGELVVQIFYQESGGM